MSRKDNVICEVSSEKGFYIGDICYALGFKTYYDTWGCLYHFDDGCFHVPGTEFSFGVASTYSGDGVYKGSDSMDYGVDAGVIGIVPLELVEQDVEGLGNVYYVSGKASLLAENGNFTFNLPDGKEIKIDTRSDYDEDE